MSHHNVAECLTSERVRPQSDVAEPPLWLLIAAAERFAAAIFLILLSPLLVTTAVAIMLLSHRAPLIAHRRVTQKGGDIWLLKLRTMWNRHLSDRVSFTLVEKVSEHPPQTATGAKTNADPRINCRFALFLRRYSVDELPQLWQVVRGQLSLVGPRPITRSEIEQHYGPDSVILLSKRPGLTGLWQVSGRSRLTYLQRRRLDLFMIQRWSLPLYLLIWGRTILRTPAGKDAW